MNLLVTVIFYHGATALVGQDLLIVKDSWSHADTPYSIGLLWTSDQLVAETSTWQHTTFTRQDIHVSGGIRTHKPSKRAAADPRLRQRGYWDRWLVWLLVIIIHGVNNVKHLFHCLYWESRSTATYRHFLECITFKIANRKLRAETQAGNYFSIIHTCACAYTTSINLAC